MRSNDAAARIAAISHGDFEGRNWIKSDTESDARIYAVASPLKIDPRGIERVRSYAVDGEISKLVNCISSSESTAKAITRNHPRRCCRTSTSSGYSSHSPPLSAGSYSYYTSASALTSTSVSTKDPYSGLAVIHESEIIPRPVWPTVIYHNAEDHNADYQGIYRCSMCDRMYSSLPRSPSPPSSPSAREILLELSRTLNSVIDDAIASPEEILRDITRIVSLGISPKNDGVYEYICPPRTFDDKNPSTSSYIKNYVPSRVNPVNSKLYIGSHCLCAGHTSDTSRSVPLLMNYNRIMRCEKDGEAENWIGNSEVTLKSCEISSPRVCEYLSGKHMETNMKLLPFRLNSERSRNGLASTESKYSMQLQCGDIGTSSEETISSSSANNWNRRLAFRNSIGDFDFTLDVTRAEHLGRTIARAKRKRQWCRILITFFGLVFFVLSVVVVSLSVTRGRKVFGSM